MSTSINIYFFARRSKVNKHGEAPIYARITIDNERFELGTKRFVNIENWLADAGKVKGSTEAAKSINSFLNALKAKAFDHQRQILQTGKRLTMEEFKNRWYGISTERSRMLMEIFKQHNEQMKALVTKNFHR